MQILQKHNKSGLPCCGMGYIAVALLGLAEFAEKFRLQKKGAKKFCQMKNNMFKIYYMKMINMF